MAGQKPARKETDMTIDGWTIDFYETVGNELACKIKSPNGRTAHACFMGDGRLEKHRTQANIEFASFNLKLTDALVDRIIVAGKAYIETEKTAEPEFAYENV